ncbi:hypothetical protein E2C01_064879 [Portunus trituberculatus]|uniref:Uncharacterized protein n=1 Tax=Portunus trituberculatus TaxID=210409 RepID=A0A5B7HM09_PORTR|nr:hypothetical protein [Portunus trituberculatus]
MDELARACQMSSKTNCLKGCLSLSLKKTLQLNKASPVLLPASSSWTNSAHTCQMSSKMNRLKGCLSLSLKKTLQLKH